MKKEYVKEATENEQREIAIGRRVRTSGKKKATKAKGKGKREGRVYKNENQRKQGAGKMRLETGTISRSECAVGREIGG